jgi:hypothetical protein
LGGADVKAKTWAPKHTFETKMVLKNGAMREVAQFVCVECGARGEVDTGGSLAPDVIQTKAARIGWKLDARKSGRTFCPQCAGPRKKSQTTKPEAPVPTPPTPIREATNDQRVLIRNLLDKHFDDAVGTYLDSMSDAAIAEKAGVPRVVVERIREAAYGPIKVDPEILAIRTELAAVKAAAEKLMATVADLTARLDRKAA